MSLDEKTERIVVYPTYYWSGDLESGSKTIVATSKQATPDYTKSATALGVPSNPKLVMKRAHLGIENVVTSHTATILNISAEIGSTVVFSKQITSLADLPYSFMGADITDMSLVQNAMALKVYFWVNSGNAVISTCVVWITYGSSVVGVMNMESFAELNHSGKFSVGFHTENEGTSGTNFWVYIVPNEFPTNKSYTEYYYNSSPLTAKDHSLIHLSNRKVIFANFQEDDQSNGVLFSLTVIIAKP